MSESTDTLPFYQPPPSYTIDESTQKTPQVQEKSLQSGLRPKPKRGSANATPLYRQEFCSKRAVYTAGIHIIGDLGVGKSSMMLTYKNMETMTNDCEKRKNECYMKLKGPLPNDMPFLLRVLHSIGDAEQEQALRYLLPIPDDIVFLCFAMDNPVSLFNVRDKWFPRMRHIMYSKKVPVILVGTKSDKIDTSNYMQHTGRKARKVGREIGAIAFMECSPKQISSVQAVFDVALRYLHSKWSNGLAKVFEKSLLPYDFEDEVLKQDVLPKKVAKSFQLPLKDKDLKGMEILGTKSQELAVKKNFDELSYSIEKKKKKKDSSNCVVA